MKSILLELLLVGLMLGATPVRAADKSPAATTPATVDRSPAATGMAPADKLQPQPHNLAPLWREVREGTPQTTTVRGIETNVLVQPRGETWREVRGPVALYGGILICVALAALAAFYLIRGPIKLREPRTGRLIKRFETFERVAHWTMATCAVILGISGLIMLFGKYVLLPLTGHGLFSWLAILCKNLHNFVGPLFLLAIVISFFIFVKDNLWQRGDGQWLKKAGGFLSGEHVPTWRFNAGEKLWFWVGVVGFGLTLSASGLLLDFPNFEQGRATMQTANMVHAIAALLFVCLVFGHIYIGTIGTEGALEAMTTGYVDEAWAREHHEYWYREVKKEATQARPDSPPAPDAIVTQP